MNRRSYWGTLGGIFLIALGVLFLLGQLMNISIWRFIWPLFILGIGLAFFAGMVAGGRDAGGLAVPGSIVTTLGLILLVQSIFGIWGTWAYGWGLLVASVGAGLFIFGTWSSLPDLRRVGRVIVVIGLGLFVIFGFFFELWGAIFDTNRPGSLFWPLVLIAVGLYLLIARPMFAKSGGPVARDEISFTSITVQPGALDGETGAVVESGQVQGVRRVAFRSLGELTVVQGEREGLEIEASQAVRERMRAEVRGDELTIRLANDWTDWMSPCYWGSEHVRYTLYVRELNSLNAAGLGNVEVPSLTTDRLELAQRGAGNVILRNLNTPDLAVHLAGLGNIEVEGQADRQEVDLNGAGSYLARRLTSQYARVRLKGLGNASVSVSTELDAAINGAGNIEFYGDPRVSQRVSGLGNINKAG